VFSGYETLSAVQHVAPLSNTMPTKLLVSSNTSGFGVDLFNSQVRSPQGRMTVIGEKYSLVDEKNLGYGFCIRDSTPGFGK